MTWGSSGKASWENTTAHQSTGASEVYVDVAGGVDMTVTVTDPDNRNEDLDNDLLYYVSDPAWDDPSYTATGGTPGDSYFALVMNSLSDSETVTWGMSFSKPVYVPDLAISDVDSYGYGTEPSAIPHDSFQDEIVLEASRGSVPITIAIVPGSGAADHGAGRVSATYAAGVDYNVSPSDAAGIVDLDPVGPITSFQVAYSNGPDDAAAEVAALASGDIWPSPIPAASTGISNNHGIHISEFVVCAGILTFGDTVWMDLDGDGVQDSDEPGMAGVLVTLSDEFANTIETQTTDSNGNYSFTEMPGFTWVISIDAPANYTATYDRDGTADNSTQFLASSANVLDADFGLQPAAGTIGGKTIADHDYDGVLDPSSSESGLAGVNITLSGTNIAGNAVSLTATTAADGSYSFPVFAGTYTVNETSPSSGYIDGIDTPGTNASANGNDSHLVVLELGESSSGNDFAEVPASSLAGVVFSDLDDDGTQDGPDSGIGGVGVTLVGIDALGQSVSISTTTDGNGAYVFDLVTEGTYTVAASQPTGYLDGVDTAGTAGGTLGADSVSAIALDLDEGATGYDFAEVLPSSLSGTVELTTGTALEGVTLTLNGTDSTGAVSQTTTTDSEGEYSFEDLRPGTYAITESQPVGYEDAGDTAGTLGGTLGSDTITAIVVSAGDSGAGYDFSEQASSISGSVLDDRNGDHIVNGSDAGIAGVTITLSGTDTTGAAISETMTTASDGSWSFGDLASGTYTVAESQPSGTIDGDDLVGSQGGSTTTNDQFSSITLAAGTAAIDYVFTEAYVSSISGVVTDDLGRAIEGVSVSLSGPVVATVQTSSDGSYIFEALLPGSYTVAESQPADYGDGAESLGTVDSSPAGVVGSDEFTGIVLSPGQSGIDYDFAETTGSITGFVRTVPGQAISGVTVALVDDDSASAVETVQTAADGSFTFDGLLLGNYSIEESQPSNYFDRDEIDGSISSDLSSNDVFAAIPLTAGIDAGGYVFVESVGGTISGTVDVDGDPLEGVTLQLRDGSGSLIDTQISAADGTFSFAPLDAGSYSVTELTPVGYGDGSDSGGDSGGSVSNDLVSAILITDAEARTGLSFSEHLGSVAGTVEADGSGLAGVVLELRDTNGVLVNTQTSGADGTYAFVSILGGTYSVTELQPVAYGDGSEVAGSVGGTVSDDLIEDIVVTAGWNVSGYDFEETTGSLSGLVFHDKDVNGQMDGDDVGIEGVLITLVGTDVEGGPVSATATTDAAGAWTFSGLLAGIYEVSEDQPPTYQDGADIAGDAGGINASNDDITQIGLAAGFGAASYFFAEQGSAVSGRVVFDSDRDGQVGTDEEEPLAGVQIDLMSGSIIISTTMTAEDGTYTFPGVGPGDYTIAQHQPDDYEATTSVLLAISVAGSSLSDINFGHRGADLSGVVFHDSDSDGINNGADSTDLVTVGRTVRLRTTDGELIATTTTSVGGGYIFTDLPAGDYTIEIELQDAQTVTTADVGDDDSDSDADPVTRLVSVSVGPGQTMEHLDVGLIPEIFDVSVNLEGEGLSTVGEVLTLTATVENVGTAPIVGGTTLMLPMDDDWTYVSASGDGWSLSIDADILTAHRDDTILVGYSYPPLSIVVVPTVSGIVEPSVTVALGTGVVETTLVNNVDAVRFGVSEAQRDRSGQLPVTGAALVLYLVAIGALATLCGLLLLLLRRPCLKVAVVRVEPLEQPRQHQANQHHANQHQQ